MSTNNGGRPGLEICCRGRAREVGAQLRAPDEPRRPRSLQIGRFGHNPTACPSSSTRRPSLEQVRPPTTRRSSACRAKGPFQVRDHAIRSKSTAADKRPRSGHSNSIGGNCQSGGDVRDETDPTGFRTVTGTSGHMPSTPWTSGNRRPSRRKHVWRMRVDRGTRPPAHPSARYRTGVIGPPRAPPGAAESASEGRGFGPQAFYHERPGEPVVNGLAANALEHGPGVHDPEDAREHAENGNRTEPDRH